MDEQNVIYIYAMEYYSALTRKAVLTDATTYMKLEDIMLCNKPITKGQILYDSTHMSHLE